MSMPLLLYKLREGLPKPTNAEDFGNRFNYPDFVPLTPSLVETDMRIVLPDFRWNGRQPTTTYDVGGVQLQLQVSGGGLKVTASELGWQVLRELSATTQWVGIEPTTMTLL